MPPPESESFDIRLASPTEYEAIGDLTVDSYDANGYLTHADGTYDDSYSTWLRNATQRGDSGGLLVAVDSTGLLGSVTWCGPGSVFREVATSDDQGEFRTLAVAADARGRGIGRALVDECLNRARALGLTEVVMCSLTTMTPAHTLYESFGFRRRPDLDWSPLLGVELWGFSLDIR